MEIASTIQSLRHFGGGLTSCTKGELERVCKKAVYYLEVLANSPKRESGNPKNIACRHPEDCDYPDCYTRPRLADWRKLLNAAKGVCEFSWEDNDKEAVEAIDTLNKMITLIETEKA